jgi:hypothetical protein
VFKESRGKYAADARAEKNVLVDSSGRGPGGVCQWLEKVTNKESFAPDADAGAGADAACSCQTPAKLPPVACLPHSDKVLWASVRHVSLSFLPPSTSIVSSALHLVKKSLLHGLTRPSGCRLYSDTSSDPPSTCWRLER